MSDYSNPYDDGSGDSTAATDDSHGDGEEKQGDESSETAVLPKSICPGMKPGEEMVLRILSVGENEYEVAYAPKEDGGGEKDESKPEPGVGAPQEGSMASMMS